jgi:hypothetical protein
LLGSTLFFPERSPCVILTKSSFWVKPRFTRGRFYGYLSGEPYHSPPSKVVQPETVEEAAMLEAEQTLINKHLELHLRRVLDSFPAISTVIFINTSTNNEIRFKHYVQARSSKTIRAYQFLGLMNAARRSRCRITKIDVQDHCTLTYDHNNIDWDNDSHVPRPINFPFSLNYRGWKGKVYYLIVFDSYSSFRRTLELLNMFLQILLRKSVPDSEYISQRF